MVHPPPGPLDQPDDPPRPRPSPFGSSVSYAHDSFTVVGATVTVMFLAGEIDTHTHHAVVGALTRLVGIGSANVVVDLTGVGYCSVDAFGVLVDTARAVEAGGTHFALVARSARVTEVSALLWPDRRFSRHPTVASAIAVIRDRAAPHGS